MARTRPPLLDGSRLAFALALASAGACALICWRGHLSLALGSFLLLVLLSLLTFLAFAWDKRRAGSGARRLSEANLLWLCVLGGAPGAWLAMRRLRHKTRKQRFVWLVPTLALLQLAGVVALFVMTQKV